MKAKISSSSSSGFSLCELLMVVAIIGILAAVAIPTLTSTSQYEAARNRRNAQEMTAVCESAQAAGVNLVVAGDLQATVRNILVGGSPSVGIFQGQQFRAAGLAEADALKAVSYLQIANGSLVYNQAGTL